MSKNCDIKDCFNLFPSFSLARAASSAEGGNVFHQTRSWDRSKKSRNWTQKNGTRKLVFGWEDVLLDKYNPLTFISYIFVCGYQMVISEISVWISTVCITPADWIATVVARKSYSLNLPFLQVWNNKDCKNQLFDLISLAGQYVSKSQELKVSAASSRSRYQLSSPEWALLQRSNSLR